MFEGLEWKYAFKRAAIFVGIWLGLIYVFKTAFPAYVNLSFDSTAGLVYFLAYPVFFFFLFAVFTAFAERSKKRRFAQLKSQKKGSRPSARATGVTGGFNETEESEGAEPTRLKGRYNPNTSRKKAARRRRRRV